MHLRRLRIWVTVVVGFLVALLIGPMAWYVNHSMSERLYANEVNDATNRVAELAATGDPHKPEQYDAWYISSNGEVTKPTDYERDIGLDWVTGSAHESPAWALDDPAPDGRAGYFLVSKLRPDGWVVVVMWDMRDQQTALHHRQLAVAASGAGLVIGITVLAWFLIGILQKPARRAQRFQRDFLADAAHELRTPLAVIQASASQTLSRPRSVDEYVDALTEVRLASERANRGVTHLLDLARLDAGGVQLTPTPLRLDLLAEEIVEVAAATGAGVQMKLADPVVVDGDESLLRQAIDNLVRNAAVRADHVTVTVTQRSRFAEVLVSDNGPGFAPAVLPHVFRRFARGDASGNGIGLALVHSIVNLHGGRIVAANRPEGGAEVRMTIPLSDESTSR